MKKDLTLSIDSEIVKKLKDSNTNISKFTEDMYRKYVYGGNRTLEEIERMEKQCKEQIKLLYGQLALYNKQKQDILENENNKEQEIRRAWIDAYHKTGLKPEEYNEIAIILDTEPETVERIPQYLEMLHTKPEVNIPRLKEEYDYFKEMMKKEFEIII